MTSEVFRSGPFEQWLRDHTGHGDLTVTEVDRPAGGFSAETVLLTAQRPESDHPIRVVVRVETPDPAVYPQQGSEPLPEIDIQYRIMSALRAHSSVPVAPLLGYEPEDSVIGSPFFVMGFIDGQVPRESPPYTIEGFVCDATPAERRRMFETGLATLAEFHRIDWRDAGLGWLQRSDDPGVADQVELWSAFTEAELRGREHPVLTDTYRRLSAAFAAGDASGSGGSGSGGSTVLCWGDPRPGNIIWQDFTPACLTDFEASCLGPAEMDLGWWLMFDWTMHEGAGVERLDGEPDRDEQRRLYYAAAGLPPRDTSLHEIFAAARYSSIVVRVMNRLEQRGHLPPESTIWLENPASTCLEALRDEAGWPRGRTESP